MEFAGLPDMFRESFPAHRRRPVQTIGEAAQILLDDPPVPIEEVCLCLVVSPNVSIIEQ